MPGGGGPGSERLDLLLVRRGLAPTRAKAQALILAGRVTSEGKRLDKPGLRLAGSTVIEVAEGQRFVGRGGEKLAGALESFAIEVAGRDAIDVGASTGGFTQALLLAGARRVVALDVGRGQLDWSLRKDPRVHVLEGINARHLTPAMLPWAPSLGVVDVSFISLRLVLPAVVECLAPGGELVALVKPQFEVGRGQVGRGGIVRDRTLHARVLVALHAFALARGWGIADACASRLRGAQGNQEYLVHLRPGRPGMEAEPFERCVQRITENEERS
jgi:23S rRNA (cytidine1920-2'-O)/16S rRNA (cytidine1409-2'-O)-methyltransferase